MPLPRELFRARLEIVLKKRPYKTTLGSIAKEKQQCFMGCPGGSHDIPPLWVYQHSNSELEMVFGFYSNFSPDDLICKVVEAGEYPLSGEGASLQFNGSRCVQIKGGEAVLIHEGRITVRSAISRNDLLEHIEKNCKSVMTAAGVIGDWPVQIGISSNIPALLDRLFLYCYCIEQAKRKIRGEVLLDAL